MPRKNIKKLCTNCHKKLNANSNTIQCTHCSLNAHLNCSNCDTPGDFLCSMCLETIFPFNFLEENEFQSVLFELCHGPSLHWSTARLSELAFQPFHDDKNLTPSKANFIDTFCDPDKNIFTGIDQMVNKCKYYVEDSFIGLADKPIQFSLIHLNIRSLRKNFGVLTSYISALNFRFDVIALTETWLKEKDDVNSFQLPNYHEPIFLNRPNEDGGGGVGLYVSNEFNFRSKELAYNSNESQILFVDIEKRNHRKLVGVTYKPPKTDIDAFLDCFHGT